MDAARRFGVCHRISTALFFSAFIFSQAAFADAPARRAVEVRWVIDGDTFETTAKERVRLIGINTPEYQPWRQKVEPYGKEAAAAAREILNKRVVYLEEDVLKLDVYGRTLAYVYLEDGRFVNALLVMQGMAKARVYPPNMRYQSILKRAQQEAKSAKLGLWSAPQSVSGSKAAGVLE